MYRKVLRGLLALPLLFAGMAYGQPDAKLPPIKKLTKVKPKASVFRNSRRSEPLVLRSEKDAAKHFAEGDLAQLLKQVDFKQQIVLVFAWRGSGQDRLDYSVLESFPQQIVFNYKPGRTRDLRPHAYVYALRSNVKWRTGAKGGRVPARPAAEYINVEVKGRLNSRVFAIGGETTGVAISASGASWELDLGKNAENRKRAAELNGKTVIVTGQLNVKRGVKLRQRWIVTVESLRAVGSGRGGKKLKE